MTYQSRSRHGNNNNHNNHKNQRPQSRRNNKKRKRNNNNNNKNSNKMNHKHSNNNNNKKNKYTASNSNNSSDSKGPHYTPPPRHRDPDRRRFGKRSAKDHMINNKWNNNNNNNTHHAHDNYYHYNHHHELNYNHNHHKQKWNKTDPESSASSLANKRRQSYSEATPEAQEIEDQNADFVASTESVSSHSIMTNGEAQPSDSSPNITYFSDKEGQGITKTTDDGIYCHNNQRTKQNYYYQRKQAVNANSNSNKSTPTPTISEVISNGECNGDDNGKSEVELGVVVEPEITPSSSSSSALSECEGKRNKFITKDMVRLNGLNGGDKTRKSQKDEEDAECADAECGDGVLSVYKPLTPKGSKSIDSTQFESHLRKNSNHNFYHHATNGNGTNHGNHNMFFHGHQNINNHNHSSMNAMVNGNDPAFNTNFNSHHAMDHNIGSMPYQYIPPQPMMTDAPYPMHINMSHNNMNYDHMEYNNNHNMTTYQYNNHQNGYGPIYHTAAPSPQQFETYNISPFAATSSNGHGALTADHTNHANSQRDGEFFVSIDVECAAIGYGHFDSAPCRIAMVDFFGNVLFDKIAHVPKLMDPLSEFTGLNAWQIANAQPLTDVLAEFHAILIEFNKLYKHGVTIIGQSVVMDIIWTRLRKGTHYQRTIDIAHEFKTQQQKWSKFTFYSLRQVAWALLKMQMNAMYHDPTEDARVTIQLYREFCLDEETKTAAKHKLSSFKTGKKFPDFRVYTKFPQCSGMYSPKRCHCGQTTAADCNGTKDIEKLRTLYHQHQNKPVLLKNYTTFS